MSKFERAYDLIQFVLWGVIGAILALLFGAPITAGLSISWGVFGLFLLWRQRLLYRWTARQGAALEELKTSRWSTSKIYRLSASERAHAERSLQQLQDQVDRLDSGLRHISTGLIILQAGGRVNWYNPPAEKLLGLSDRDIGRPLHFVLRQPATALWLKSGELGRHQFKTHDNLDVVLQRSVYPGGAQSVVEAVDCTQIEEAEQERRRLIDDMTHEINTPLTVLQGYLEPLLDAAREGNSEQLDVYQNMLRQCERIHLLSSSLPELLLPMHARTHQQPQRSHLAAVVSECINNLSSSVQSELVMDIDANIEVACAADSLYTIVSNLVGNAVKYTPSDGQISLTGHLNAWGVSLCVADNGSGIAPEHIPRLTERFFRTGEHSGMGLGLAIVEQLLQQCGGHLEIKSTPGEGSTFICHFARGQ